MFSFGEIGLNVEIFVMIEEILALSDYQVSDALIKKKKFRLSDLTTKKAVN